jgi:predicted MPP superfamily phosphohydrolase
MFFIISFIILILMYGYVGWRIVPLANLDYPYNYITWFSLLLMVVALYLPLLMRTRKKESFFSDILSWVGYMTFGFISTLFLVLFARDLVLVIGSTGTRLAGILRDIMTNSVGDVSEFGATRREALVRGFNHGVMSFTALLSVYGVYETRKVPEVREVEIPLENLHDDLNGFRIVQVSDIHVGPTVKKEFVEKIAERVNSLDPDIFVNTGDMIDGTVEYLLNDVRPLENVRSRHGNYFVTGNHEYYNGVHEWMETAESLGMKTLVNESISIRKGEGAVLLAGVPDYSGEKFFKSHRADPALAIKQKQGNEIKILLSHQPRAVSDAAAAGYHLQISGHTHGGRYFPWNYLVKREQSYLRGLHRIDNTWLYVSSGTGYWGPVTRMGSKSEITLITLVKA